MSDLIGSLRQRIHSGQYPAGTWLPTERDLAEEFGVARRTVRRAIAHLEQEGLVRCRPRFRPIVASLPADVTTKATAPASGTSVSVKAASRLAALVMWHGGSDEGGTAQQRIFWGMNHRLALDGFHGIFLDLGDRVRSEPENAEREAAHLRYALAQGFAGIVFYPYAYRRNRELVLQVARSIPLILIDRMIPGIQSDFVGVDNHGAMVEATRHLLALGHRRILFATTAESINTVQERAEGYRQAMEAAPGGPLAENFLTVPPHPSYGDWSVFESLFHLPPERRPTAILCINDYVALDVYRQLRGLGLRVPDDVALCGFDDIVPLLPDGVGLTTVAQPFEQIGQAAAEMLLARCRTDRPAAAPGIDHIELPTRLVVRESTEKRVPGEAEVVPDGEEEAVLAPRNL